MKIVVTTPTGHVGSRVAQLLLQAGVFPTLLAREPAKLDDATRKHAAVIQADQGDTEAIVRATQGADCLFWVNPAASDVTADPVEWYARLGATAARAVVENGIAHTVFLSSVGAEKRHGAGEIDGLARSEELLDATGAHVLHLRCGFFFTNLLLQLDDLRRGQLSTTWPLDFTMPWVDPRDIGDVAAARLLAADWSGRQVQAVHGPEDLTFAQVAEILSRSVAQTVRAETMTDDELRSSLQAAGLGTRQVEGIVGMSAGMRENFTPDDVRSVFTTTPTTLAAWAHAELSGVF